ncbi:UNVERIFIED_CONTAM: STS14 protein [Sesamum radiatum]|uniref:STS14 protein n=1 Tax=Sesamum radiatum TaxID=300843 RepID=A0AAW2RC01_SESRA
MPMFSSTCATAAAAAAAAAGNDSKDYLEAHNQARAEVGVGPLQWSQPLAKIASLLVRLQRDKHNCSFANLANSKYGGNQLWAGGFRVTPRAAVETWVAEKKFYNYQDNSCAPDHRCGVYTQVVWKQSVELGCAQAGCAKDQSSLTICFYNPPGNIVGEKPY